MRRLTAAVALACALLVPSGARGRRRAAADRHRHRRSTRRGRRPSTRSRRTKFKHPAWGWQHSERDYRLAVEVAQGDHLTVDTDVLFAAALLHDMAAFAPYEKKGMEHGDRAAETSEAVLRDAGFPMAKYPAVQAAERGHMYYSNAGTVPEAIALHDADSLDFLGAIGAVRILALTGEDKPDATRAIKTLRGFVKDIPPKLITATAKRMGAERAAELTRLLDQVQAQTYGGAAT